MDPLESPSPAADAGYFARLEEIFHSASAFAPDQQANFVRESSGGNETLRQEVMSLLATESHIDALVYEPPSSISGSIPLSDRWIGRQIGAFHIQRRLGQGGMGVVYLGERNSGDLEQVVAIKLMSTDLQPALFEQRFLLEKDTLATLEHKNVVNFIDGGVTGEGIPYLAMEYVEGLRLDAACDDPATDTESVLGWVLQLCEGVSYVHRNMLLHRDLKPSNVLVTTEGLVKLVDFGTLKSLATDDRSLTQPNMQALTVRYASPERFTGGELSTAADVFSLGMMLYRLLLGHLPHELDNLSIGRYLDALKAEPYGSVAAGLRARGTSKQLSSDLEAIVRKALRFGAAERYQTADSLAQDLQAAMDGRMISAIRATHGNNIMRFVKRHRAALALAVGTLAILILGVALMVHGSRRLRAEQLRADRGTDDEVRLTHFLLASYFDQLKEIPGSTSAQKQAVSQALGFVDSLASVAQRRDLESERVRAYTEMGSLLGNPYENNLGDTAGAVKTLSKAVSLARQLSSSEPDNAQYHQMDADANLALGRVYFASGDPHKASYYLVTAVNENRDVLKRMHPDSAALAEAASVSDGLGDVNILDGAVTLHDPVEAARRYKEAQQLDADGLRIDPGCSRCRRGVALEYWKLGMLAADATEAQHLYEAGIATLDEFSPQELASDRARRILLLTKQKLGLVYLQTGRTKDGLSLLNAVRADLQKRVLGDPTDARSHFDLFGLDLNMAAFTDVFGTHDLALPLDKELLGEALTLVQLEPDNIESQMHKAGAELRLGRMYLHDGDSQRGMQLLQSAAKELERLASTQQGDSPLLQEAADAQIEMHEDPNLAVTRAKEAIATAGSVRADQYLTLARGYLLAGDLSAAKVAAQRAAYLVGNRHDPLVLHNLAMAHAILKASSIASAQKAIQSMVVQVRQPNAG